MDSQEFPVKTILKTQLKAGNAILPEHETYYRIAVIKTV